MDDPAPSQLHIDFRTRASRALEVPLIPHEHLDPVLRAAQRKPAWLRNALEDAEDARLRLRPKETSPVRRGDGR